MNISTIEQGEELLKRVNPNDWEVPTEDCSDEWYGQMKQLDVDVTVWGDRDNWTDESETKAQLIVFLVNHASELLQMAREVERMKTAIEFCSGSCHNALD